MKKKYTHYTIEDLLTDDAFITHQLSPSTQSTMLWKGIFEKNPTLLTSAAAATQVIRQFKLGLTDYAAVEISSEAKAHLFKRISESNQLATAPKIVWKQARVWLAAATILFALGVGWYFLTYDSLQNENLAALNSFEHITKENLSSEPLSITLPDGSTVTLKPSSTITYDTEFGQTNRTTVLSGEAEFDVIKNKEQPFLVVANEITTRVLGTKFTVKAFTEDTDVTVTVQEGKVSVFTNKQTKVSTKKTVEGVVILPNQQAVFDRKSSSYSKQLVEQPTLQRDVEKTSFIFNETPITEALTRLQKAYGVEIEFDAELLEGCEITAPFTTENLYEKIEIITQTINGTYENVDGKIIIYSRGCR